MYKNKKVSLILPVYNEEENILNAINEFTSLKIFDEIIVVDNNSTDDSKKIIKSTKVRYVLQKIQGYGAAIRKGLQKARGELLVICEPDGSFQARDTLKLIKFIDKYDCIFGTRTNKKYIRKGAKMYFALRLGNVIVAKFLSLLFPGYIFTDVGCTLKILKKKCYLKIKKKLKVISSELQPEIMINLILQKYKIIEIPVIYKKRKGNSKITRDFFSTSIVALKMLKLIFLMRVNYFFKVQ